MASPREAGLHGMAMIHMHQARVVGALGDVIRGLRLRGPRQIADPVGTLPRLPRMIGPWGLPRQLHQHGVVGHAVLHICLGLGTPGQFHLLPGHLPSLLGLDALGDGTNGLAISVKDRRSQDLLQLLMQGAKMRKFKLKYVFDFQSIV